MKKDKILKQIFIFIIISLIAVPLILGIFTMVNGAVDPWSGTRLTSSEAFFMGAIMLYGFYCWPYILISILYIVFYTIKYRKTNLVKCFWLCALGIILLIFLLGGIIVI